MAAFVEHGVFFMFLMFPISISFLGNAFCQFLTDEWRDIACFNNRAFDSNH